MDDLNVIKEKLEDKMGKAYSPRIFLDKLRLIDEESRKASSYTDPRYIPFYYWLGTMVAPESVLEIGLNIGLCSSCFLQGCKSVKKFLAFQRQTDEFYSCNIGRSNVKDNYKGEMQIHIGDIYDEAMQKLLELTKWDMVIINEEVGYDVHKAVLDICWAHMNFDGILAIDHINKHKPTQKAYFDFCKGKNRTPLIIDTRYGVGMIKK